MSLVPYTREGREIVLRHYNAVVVRDPSSQRLEIRALDLTECPTCHQPWRTPSPERHFDNPEHRETYVSPEYFRMLQAGRHPQSSSQQQGPPPSPVRRLVEPVRADADDDEASISGIENSEFMGSTPAPEQGSRIRSEAFSPNYFNTFFIEERELGRGGKGVVLLVRHEIDGCPLGHFACKRVPVGDNHVWLEKVLGEVKLLAKLSHPNLVSYRHVWLEDVTLNRFGPSVACAFILQQYCNAGDLLNYVIGDIPKEVTKEQLKAQMRRRSKGGGTDRPVGLQPTQRMLPFEEIYSLFKDITSGLAYLHAANYIHRDLKPSNCLLHREGNQLICLISDFGEVQPENMIRESTGATGTISYCAPEVLKRDATGRFGNFTTKSDIFSLGMILYFMCFGRLPYHSANTVHEELEDIDMLRAEITDWKGFQDERRERPDLPSKLYQLLKKLLSVTPAERPSASEVLSAMKNESPLDGVTRGPSSGPSLGFAGRRIQNLDSPMPPSTPVPDPTKHATVTSTSDEDLPAAFGDPPSHTTTHNILQKRGSIAQQPSTPRHRGHNNHNLSLTLTRSHDGYTRNASRSPERSMGTRGAVLNSTGPSPLDSPVHVTTPLLMPPPTTRLGRIRDGGALAWYRTVYWLRYYAAWSGPLARLALLGLKLLSLSWFCWPYSSSIGTLLSLFILAALDVWSYPTGMAGPRSQRDMARVGFGGMAGYESGTTGASRWMAGWRRTGTLLALHCLVLWVTSRSGMLCAAPPQGKWENW